MASSSSHRGLMEDEVQYVKREKEPVRRYRLAHGTYFVEGRQIMVGETFNLTETRAKELGDRVEVARG